MRFPIPDHPEAHDLVWLLLATALVMVMQGGFCLVESGMVRSKNAINVAFKNVVDFCISISAFGLFGCALMFGDSVGGWIGTTGFDFLWTSHSPGALAFFLFQIMFCGTAATIVSGAVAERMRLKAYLLLSLVTASLIYPIFGHWVWGPGGWLATRGFVDFAGSSAVHGIGGWVALAAVLHLGPRLGRFAESGPAIHGQDLVRSAFGAMLLWFGWFGFNGGSTLGMTDRVPTILVNTNLAAAFGGLGALLGGLLLRRQLCIIDLISGVLSGLVAITASCHAVSPGAACLIGSIGGCLGALAGELLERWRIDDAVGAVPVHAVAGAWGTLAVAIHGDPNLLGTGLSWTDQLGIQAVGVVVCFVWAFGSARVAIALIDRVVGMRVSSEEERIGLNLAEHGTHSALQDLLSEMERHEQTGDFRQVGIDPHTELGAVALRYNQVLLRVQHEVNAREKTLDTLRERESELTRRALYDELTGLPNRALLEDRIARAIERTRRDPKHRFAVLFLDVDRFKVVNDSLGHAMGDALLVRIAAQLREGIRTLDTSARISEGNLPARIGGDEFVVLVDGIARDEDAVRVAHRVHDLLAQSYEISGRVITVDVSLGVVTGHGGYESPGQILRDADIAMYRAKADPDTSCVVFDHQMHAVAMERLAIEADLRAAIDDQQLVVFYQPIVATRDGRPVGFEALVRWNHPEEGLIGPDRFISIAEETGLIDEIGAWVLEEATRQLAAWRSVDERFASLSINVNLSPRQLGQTTLVDQVKQALERHALPPHLLCVEVTESLVMRDEERATQSLSAIRALGVGLAMDDFGTGHSSLSVLHRLPFAIVKIDRSFVCELGRPGRDEPDGVVRSILELARALGLRTVAEGVETEEQCERLRALGCDRLQGYLFSRPLPAEAVVDWVSRVCTPDATERAR
ncbi:ammonium transporter [Myxococcota bacterium]|nr:ammonium transporter [Myxococcota bacterium]